LVDFIWPTTEEWYAGVGESEKVNALRAALADLDGSKP
jgi:hypothetical protein